MRFVTIFMKKVANLYTAQELEELLGRKYFYRQGIYRLAEDGKISSFQVSGVLYFSSQEVATAILERLANRIRNRYPWIRFPLRVKFDENQGKVITVYGFPNGKKIITDTVKETEEDLLNKIEILRGEVTKMPDIPVYPQDEQGPPPPPPHHGPPPHHREIIDALRRIEDRLARIEEKIS